MHRFAPIAALLALATAAHAAPMSVPVDEARRVPIAGSAANVVVGNTAIAEVRAIDSRTLMIIGKRPGTTNVVVFDAGGRTLYNEQVQVSAGAGSAVTVYRGGVVTEYACSPYCKSTGETETPVAAPAAPVNAP